MNDANDLCWFTAEGKCTNLAPQSTVNVIFPGFFLNHFLNWSIINLKCCVSCGYVAKRFSYIHLHIHILLFSLLNHVPFFATPWPVAHQAPLSVAFPREEYWSGLPFPSPGDLPGSGIKPISPVLQVDFFYHCAAREAHIYTYNIYVYIILFHYWLLQDIEYSPLCYPVGLCWLSVLYIIVCIC